MNKLIGILGLAKRARKTLTGEQVLKSIQNHSAKLIVISDMCGNNTRKKLLDKCTFYQIPYVVIEDTTISMATGNSNRKSIAIIDEGFAKMLEDCLKG